MTGRLPAGFSDAVASVLRPGGTIETVPLEADGDRFSLSLPAGAEPGAMHVSIDGVGRRGPTKLLQLTVEVGRPLPRDIVAFAPEREPSFGSTEEAELYAAALLARDRAALGLPALAIDPALSAVARAHSEDMRDRGFFGHLSPTTGLASDRLAAAGVRTTSHAENLAKNDTLAEAQESLMHSVSHRASIVRPEFSRVGIGLARAREGDRQVWYLTQLFSTPVELVDPGSARVELLSRINDARRDRSLPPLDIDDRLAVVAEVGASSTVSEHAAGNTSSLPEILASRARDAVRASVGVSVHVVFGLDQFQPPDVALDRRFRHIGIGVAQSATDLHGLTGVTVIVSR
jgi:uncharacterized protein YkwD